MSEEAIYLPPSPDWDYITLKWAGNNLDGSVVVGTIEVSFDGTGPFLDDHETLPISVFKKTIVSNILSRTFVIGEDSFTVGYAELKVPVSNDPDVTGSDATYTFTENIPGGRKNITFYADAASPGGVIWLNKIAPTTPNPGTPISVVSWADFVELADRVTAVENGGGGEGGTGTPGEDGESPELQVASGFIQWKYPSDASWTNLVSLESLKGEDGAPGIPGTDGEDGAPGKSAYQSALDAGFVGTEAEWIASLQGQPGDDGAPGADGDDGAPGADGLGWNYWTTGDAVPDPVPAGFWWVTIGAAESVPSWVPGPALITRFEA